MYVPASVAGVSIADWEHHRLFRRHHVHAGQDGAASISDVRGAQEPIGAEGKRGL